MKKTILVTGATDGIGLETARVLAKLNHEVLVHGRNPKKIEKATSALKDGEQRVKTYVADLARAAEVEALARAVLDENDRLDVLINNAGVYNAPAPITEDGLDVRFAVNTIAPYLLTQRLLPLMGTFGRVINLSSAAQASVEPRALTGKVRLSDGAAYAQSKLALTMWTRAIASSLGERGPSLIAVNPGSMLGTKMVKEAFGTAGRDIRVGAEILRRIALSDEFAAASGRYYDNDSGRFAPPHPDARDPEKTAEVVRAIEMVLATSGASSDATRANP